MNLGIEGKIALIAAGSRGIGFAAAQALAKEGAIVSICGRDVNQLDRAIKQLGNKHRAYQCDLNQLDSIQKWIESTQKDLGVPSILVTNTGGPQAGQSMQLTEDQWKQGFESTVLNIIRMMKFVLPQMQKQKWGRIVHITSLVAKEPDPMLTISSTLRVGISSLSRIQAKELGPSGITVNCILPGHTETDRQTHLLEVRAEKNKSTVEEERLKSNQTIPLRRMARSEEIGDVIAFICSERASYVTGAQIMVDGGITEGLG